MTLMSRNEKTLSYTLPSAALSLVEGVFLKLSSPTFQ